VGVTSDAAVDAGQRWRIVGSRANFHHAAEIRFMNRGTDAARLFGTTAGKILHRYMMIDSHKKSGQCGFNQHLLA